ncbi:MAG: tRNA (adenosine(37)-N6)-threonylcarbamoyltransferase complex transferase subunit TsaD, partial [Dehalococcoidia bacterium]|nr:tRNA (adenosine(37)-N6)-threonylcarbamoyltransferase complex transferase subunit TsaD [Dehalococcoidia bacterium]
HAAPAHAVRVLGIETSCDETAAAVVEDGRRLRSNVVASQAALHGRYGGVVPEVASRQHLEAVVPVVQAALQEADCRWRDIDAIAVTAGPGLVGALLVGVNVAKAIAYARDLPLIAVNHLEAHLYANWIDEEGGGLPPPSFPLVGLIVSGGHTDLVVMKGHGRIRRLGRTRDDAAGEAFDKVARLLGLGFPGGPAIERSARSVAAPSHRLPRAWLGESDDFSFSGLKTAVLHLVRGERGPAPSMENTAAAFQDAVVDVLATKTARAAGRERVRGVLLSGGVAANGPLRRVLRRRSPVRLYVPSPALCTDNGAMIAACAYYRSEAGRAGWDLDVTPSLPVA